VPNKWRPIIEEQLSQLSQLPLYDFAETIQMTVIADRESDYHELQDLLKEKWPKVSIGYITGQNTYEYPGIAQLYLATGTDPDDTLLLYFHSKGMTSNEHNTRKNLFDITIANYQEYLDAFEQDPELDIAGYAPHVNGFIYFNFFWIRAKYIQKWCPFPKPNPDRFIWEIWFGSDYSTKIKLTGQPIRTWSPVLGYDQISNKYDSLWQSIFGYITRKRSERV
jgi:hypothetical protein